MRVEQNQNNFDRKMIEAKKVVAKAGTIPEKGDVIRGAIQDIKGQQVKILLQNNQVIDAKLAQNFGFVIGQDVSLMVKESISEQLLLTPIVDEQAALEGKLLSILEQVDLKPSDNNLEIVKTLMQNDLPLSKEMINQVAKAMYKFPDLPLKDIVFMIKHDIPITPENVVSFSSLSEGNPILFNQLEGLVTGLTELAVNEPELVLNDMNLLPNSEASKQLIQVLTTDFSLQANTNENNIESQINILNEPMSHHMSSRILDKSLEQVNQLLTQFGKAEVTKEMSLMHVMDIIEDLPSKEITGKIKMILVKPMLEQASRQAIFMNMEQIKDAGQVKDYFNKLYEQVSTLSRHLDGNELPESIKEEASSAKQGLEFIRALNQDYQFMELPFVVDDQLKDGRLYVLNNKSRKKANKDSVSVLMQLDFLNLKHLDIYINKQDKQVDIDIYTSTTSVKEVLEKPLSNLHTALTDKGYQLRHIGVQVREDKVDIRDQFLEMDEGNKHLKQMSFDIRV